MELLAERAERSRGMVRVDREKLALPTGKQRCALASLAMSWLHLSFKNPSSVSGAIREEINRCSMSSSTGGSLWWRVLLCSSRLLRLGQGTVPMGHRGEGDLSSQIGHHPIQYSCRSHKRKAPHEGSIVVLFCCLDDFVQGQDSSPEEDSGGQEDGRTEDVGAAVVAGCKTPPVFQSGKERLDFVTPAIQPLVVMDWLLAAATGRNARRGALPGQHLADSVPPIPLTPNHRSSSRWQVLVYPISTSEVAALPLTQVGRRGPPLLSQTPWSVPSCPPWCHQSARSTPLLRLDAVGWASTRFTPLFLGNKGRRRATSPPTRISSTSAAMAWSRSWVAALLSLLAPKGLRPSSGPPWGATRGEHFCLLKHCGNGLRLRIGRVVVAS